MALAVWAEVLVPSSPGSAALRAVATEAAAHLRPGAVLVDTRAVLPAA